MLEWLETRHHFRHQKNSEEPSLALMQKHDQAGSASLFASTNDLAFS